MAKADIRQSVLQIVNEVRRLIGYEAVTKLDEDEQSLVLLRLLNEVITKISDYGDWHELIASAAVTAETSVREYSINKPHPVQRIYEIAFHTDRQALYPISLEEFLQYQRGAGGSTGRPRFAAIKGVDSQGNPKFAVHPQPGTSQNGNPFSIIYFRKPRLYDTTSMDDEVPFPANVVILGLYAKALVEEAGGTVTQESTGAEREFFNTMDEALKRFSNDFGTNIFIGPNRGY